MNSHLTAPFGSQLNRELTLMDHDLIDTSWGKDAWGGVGGSGEWLWEALETHRPFTLVTPPQPNHLHFRLQHLNILFHDLKSLRPLTSSTWLFSLAFYANLL